MDPRCARIAVIVLEASVLADALLDDKARGSAARTAMSGATSFAAPELIYPETLAACRRAVRSGSLDADRADRAIDRLARLPLTIEPHAGLVQRIWELRDRSSAYDGAYVAIAEALGAPLLTADERLARAAQGICEVQLVVADG